MSNTNQKLRVAVVGGGIGGLCLAIGLGQYENIDVQVYEAAHKFSEIGAGVALGPNAQRALRLIRPEAEEAFRKEATGSIGDENKNVFAQTRFGSGLRAGELIAISSNETGAQSVHRAKFLDQLVKLVPNEISHFGKRLTHIDESREDGVVLHFKDETTVVADCVVGFDGVHSVTREHIMGSDHPALKPVFTGSIAYRGLIPMAEARPQLGLEATSVPIIYSGMDGMIMTYPIDHGEILNVVAIDEGYSAWEGPWVQPANQQKIKEKFSDWGDACQKIIKFLDNAKTMCWSMWEAAPAPSYYKQRVAMCGDAAHATTPFQGQGAGQAIEDALIMSKLLAQVQNPEEVPLAFAVFDEQRRQRTQEVVRTSHEAGELFALRLPGIGDDSTALKANIEKRMDWMWLEDLEADIKKAVSAFEARKA